MDTPTGMNPSTLSQVELDQIWEGNATILDQIQGCVHDLISEVAARQPEAWAVCAWDGNFTYTQLDDLSTKLAKQLINQGAAPTSSIPLLFEKSRWTSVAMLAVIKAGCSAIALDGTQPDSRLRSIVQQAQPPLMVASAKYHARACALSDVAVVQLDDTLLNSPGLTETQAELPEVAPSDVVYISFTSGTTGQPKGACISHANVRSAVRYQGKELGFGRDSRVFDFAPYSFDVAWSNFLHTLCAGGCLCVASEDDMLTDLSAAITKFEATLINITPTVLRTVHPIPPSLKSVLLSGEMPYRENVTQWAGKVRLLNTYGPTECTFKCAFAPISPTETGRPHLGKGVAFCLWLVDVNDDTKLAPIGAVGELYLEGPLVGQGYLSDPEKTASAFVHDPPWLLAGSGHKHPGRRGRLYKTGDLAKYQPDGNILFVGRKDASQLKIRGQRVEIGDVEHHVRAGLDDALPVIVDVITPQATDVASLALFVVTKNQNVDINQIRALMDGLAEKLRNVLPAFMIPSAYLPVDEIPVASTGKVDRRRLREFGSGMTWQQIVALQSTIMSVREHHEPANDKERQLRQIWADVLGLEVSRISTHDSFLRLGGDSIAAMRVVAMARKQHLSLTVGDLFKTPTLVELAQICKFTDVSDEDPPITPFSLLKGTRDQTAVCEDVAKLCGVDAASIEDVYPCTPLQEGMLAISVKSEGSQNERDRADYVSRTVYELPASTDLERFGKAWTKTTQRAPILRTRIVDIPGEGLVQVVVKQDLMMGRSANIAEFLEQATHMGLGAPLCRAGLVTGDPGHPQFVVEMHHAIFDGWVTALILEAVESSYHDTAEKPLVPFQPFLRHVLAAETPDAAAFWQRQLAESEATVFPSPGHRPTKKDVGHVVFGLQWPQSSGITPSSVVRSALAVLMASYTNSSDVRFGATVSGRTAPVHGIEHVAGPTIATVPVRVRFDWGQTVQSLQQQVQHQAIELNQYEQYGLSRIQRIDEEASQFQLLLVVQPLRRATSPSRDRLFGQAKSIVGTVSKGLSQQESGGESDHSLLPQKNPDVQLVAKDGDADSMGMYNDYAMMIICHLEDAGFTLQINFDSGAIGEEVVGRMAGQFEHLVRQFCTEQLAESKLGTINPLTQHDLGMIWEWNQSVPESVHRSVPSVIDKRAGMDPDALAISSWDKQLTYQQLKGLSTCLAHRLRQEGVTPGAVVILSFEKSSWLVVCMIAALRIGAIALPVSAPTLTPERALEMVETVQPKLVLTASAAGEEENAFHGHAAILSVSELVLDDEWLKVREAHETRPSDPALILFTSGSTGAPKSILWSHETLSSNICAASASFGLTSTSRTFQFAGYEFDVSTVEALATLSAGGTLCIPSEADRTNRLAGAIDDFQANWICLTPSVSESLHPRELPSLKTIVFAGEKLSQKTALKWTDRLESVYNWYGPAEASVATSCLVRNEAWAPGMIGRGSGGRTWLVDPKDRNQLAPIGAISELCIEGPIVAEYAGTNGASLNEKSFFAPPWLHASCEKLKVAGRYGRLYQTGDLVKYDADGKVVFIGRKNDSQRKLRGQRVELSEIELRVQESLAGKFEATVVAEIFCPESSDKETLALFVSPLRRLETDENIAGYLKQTLKVDELEQDLAKSLPPYMIPKVYVPLDKIPMNHSGKTDRKRLRQIGSSFTQAQLAAMQPSRKAARKPATAMEKRLQQLWADVIGGGLETDAIHATDNFLRLGGDSITAMRLVAAARHQGLALTVADVFQSPLLEDMAKCVKYDDADADSASIAPFSLLHSGIDEATARGHAARLCAVPESRITDVYPCTALQQGLLALGARKHGQYVSRSVLRLQPGIEEEKLRQAWSATVQKLPLLRTRIVDLPGQGLVQVVLDGSALREATDLDSYLREDEETHMGLGTDLCRAAIIDRDFAFTIHHCTYDGNTLQMILEELESQYLGRSGLTVTPFQRFIHHLSKIDPEEAADFWKGQLSNTEAGQFPALPSATYAPQATDDLEHNISVAWPRTGVTPSIIVRSAWAILASQYTSSSDVLFAVTVSGRQANMKGVESCAGPTISTVPVAIALDWDETVSAFLARLQRHMVDMTPYEQFGLQNIHRVASGNLDPRLIQTLLVVQPVAEGGRGLDQDSRLFEARRFASNVHTLGTDPFNNYALQVVCELQPDGLRLRLSFDGGLIDAPQMRRVARQFETVLQQLCSEALAESKLDALQTASDADLGVFWAQNAQLPDEARVLVHDAIALGAKTHPGSVAIDAWDGRFFYSQLDELSTDIAHKLVSMGIRKGSVVALCSEKSKWVPLVQVAVYKAGGVTVLQSVAVPELRMAKVFKNIGVQLAVVSESRLDVVSKHARCCTVDQLLQPGIPPDGAVSTKLPDLSMSDPAAILVSSGSTGEPKQVLWSHRTLAANVEAHGRYLGVGAGTAVLQFASYDFDVSTIESASTLAHAGRLCVPSEAERLDGLGAAVNRFGVQFMNITPSTAKALRPDDITDRLAVLVLSGENLVQEDVRRWQAKCPVLNWYGPAEHPATIMVASDDNWHTGVIGQVYSKQPALCWLVDPRNQDRLVPFGTVGEIALEGPLCADGYIGNEAMTQQRFRDNLQFLVAGHGPSKVAGRKNRVYCSGDLGRYDSHGNLVYMGRKDAQLKIRGQLVAPEEVETQIRKWISPNNPDLEVVVDAVSRDGRNLTLVAYLTVPTREQVEKLTSGLNDKLGAALPKYAVPSYYIPVPVIPTNASGKKDRKKLREIGDAYEPPRSASGHSQRREPTTTAERALRELWSVALQIDAEAISANDSFLRVGDSIQAMRLVGMARQQGLVLTVAEVFEYPVLEDMAKRLKNRSDASDGDVVIAPFALLDAAEDIETARHHAASMCGVDVDDVEDLFPCTPLQEGLLALTMKSPGAYTGRNILELAPHVDIAKFKAAWENVGLNMPILRTRIIDIPGQGLVQAVIQEREYWREADSLDDYLQKENDAPMGLGSRLMRCAVFKEHQPGKDRQRCYFALTLHHSIYDGLTMPLILETLESLYHGASPLRPCPFQTFVQYIRERDPAAEAQFWKSQFAGLEAAQFPGLPTSTYEPQTDSTLTHPIRDVAWRADNATPSTTLRAVFALLCSHHSHSADVVFGTVVAGRKAPVAGIERIAGPTIATVPIRVKLDNGGADVLQLLATVQSQATDMIPHEQAGLSAIRQISPEAQRACQFQTLLVIQPQEQPVAEDGSSSTGLFVSEAEHGKLASSAFDSYALTMICTLGSHQNLSLEFRFDSQVISRDSVGRMARQFEHLLQRVNSSALDKKLLADVSLTTDQDLDQIWQWNSDVLGGVDGCVHELIAEAAKTHPESTAVCAWDGELTYGRLEDVSSAIAGYLVDLGVRRNTIVPLCFEKSLYVPVAMLGVLKAGAAVLLLDSTLPASRLQVIVQQVDPMVILSSATNEALASQLGGSDTKTVVLGPESTFMSDSAPSPASPPPQVHVAPSDLLYAVFTSGSTGTPKGCLMEHRHFTSAMAYQQHALPPLTASSRLYDFASYAFDAAVLGILRALLAGATLCIPSESERKGDLERSIRRFGTTDIYLTSSTARLVDPDRIPTMRNIYLAGEVVTGDDVSRWTPHADAFVGYGPAECTVGTVWYRVPSNGPDAIPSPLPIGKGAGASTWIVDPKSSERLSPVGAVGELYLEGPLVGRGYLGDDEKTSPSFIEDPSWLLQGSPDGRVPGRKGRLYKTGDLVRYGQADGTLVFVGRKDTQVKLRGQRIELGEVEHHLRQYLASKFPTVTVVAEVVVPSATGRAALAAFVQLPPADWPRLQGCTSDMEDALQQCLPAYMVPSVYVPVESIPLAVSGKTDRKGLREMGANLTLDQLDGGASDGGPSDKLPVTESQLRLRELWASVLRVPADKIRADSSFLRLGGDSISAMRLTALARSRRICLTVPDILQKAKLSEMAKAMTDLLPAADPQDNHISAFSLLKNTTKDAATVSIMSQCSGIEAAQIQDAFPCTGVQKSLLSMTAKSDNSYIARFLLRLRADIDIPRFRRAWEDVSRTTAPILRYRIVDIPSEGLVQVQVDEPLQWDTSDSIETYLEGDKHQSMGLGARLTRLALIEDGSGGDPCCILTQHHAIYDGYSVDLLLGDVAKAYAGQIDKSPVAPFQAFIKHVVDVNQEEARTFWRSQFAESEAVPFPALPSEDYRPKADSTVRRHIDGFAWPKKEATSSTIIRAAWSILAARYTGTDDVVFGAMVTGRQGSLPGIDRMIAPLINAVPVRVRFYPQQSLDELLGDVQQQSISMIPYEHTELLDIRRLGGGAERGSRFNTLLVVQPAGQKDYVTNKNHAGPFRAAPETLSSRDGLDDFNPNAVMVMCQLTAVGSIDLEISFDSHVIDAAQMGRMAAQFEHVLRQVCASDSQKVEDIDTLSSQDLEELWTWNATVPTTVSKCVHDLIGETMQRHPQDPAIHAWDGSLSYAELDDLSRRLALHLVSLGAGPGTIIPLCFEKSMWYPVAALAVMRSGAACLAMDATQPEARLRAIVQQVDAKLLLSSAGNEAMASRLSDAQVVIVGKDHPHGRPDPTGNRLPQVRPTDVLYIVFTSGSTGVPKGIVTTHQNFASAATHQAEMLHIRRSTRVFDFVSYNFDVSWSNHLQTLIAGGCLCIPSETERRNDIVGAFHRLGCDYTYFTPSVARSLEPSEMPTLTTLAMGGEPIQSKEVARWSKQAGTIIGIYGPAECAQALSFARLTPKTRNNHVGHAYGANTWLVQPGRPDRLAAVGTVAELAIEGPTVSRGYFRDPTKTAASYIRNPPWLVRGTGEHAGRPGTLYMTGDLLRYSSDGSLDFIGRKDALVKLRGQRIELAEVEYHVGACLQDSSLVAGIAAEIITPSHSNNPLLAVFLSVAKEGKTAQEIQSQLAQVLDDLEQLADRVPQYMVPGAYIEIDQIPMTTTNKTDRRALRELGSAKTLEELAALQSRGKDRRMPSSPMEKRLQGLWAAVLQIDAASISAESNFLRIGGESIAAMRLVAAARGQKLSLTVADIFRAPRLADLALLVKEAASSQDLANPPPAPFSLLETDDTQCFLEKCIAPHIEGGLQSVRDALPATDFQQQSVLDALQDPPGRYPHWIFDLPTDVDFSRLQQACVRLVNHFDILHSIFVRADGRFWQVVLSDFEPTYDVVDAGEQDMSSLVESICAEDIERPRVLGRSFIRFIVVKHASGKHKFILRISHAQFDGFSWGSVLEALWSIYSQQDSSLSMGPRFSQYIAYSESKREGSQEYWRSRLQGSPRPCWSTTVHDDAILCNPENRLTLKMTIAIPLKLSQAQDGVSVATLFHAACALVLSRQFQQPEIVLGRLVTGRAMLPGHLQSVVGPTMTEVPIRVPVEAEDTVATLANRLQNQFLQDAAHESVGMVQIIRNCTEWPDEISDFGWRTAFQQQEEGESTFLGRPSTLSFYEGAVPPRTRPEIYATPTKDGGLELEFEGNKKVIAEDVVREVLAGLRDALQ